MSTTHRAPWTTCARTATLAVVVALSLAPPSRGFQPYILRPAAITRNKTTALQPPVVRRSDDRRRALAASSALVDASSSSKSIDRTDDEEEDEASAAAAAAAIASVSQNDLFPSSNDEPPIPHGLLSPWGAPMDYYYADADADAVLASMLRNERRMRRDDLATKRRAVTELEDEVRNNQDKLFLLLATIPPLIGFFTWNDISQAVSIFVDMYGGGAGRAVDGNQFAVNLLRPTIVGVVVPVIAIALGTLVSTTVNVLRERQVELRALVSKEVCELRLLRRAVFGMFGTRQHARRRAYALALLHGYTIQLALESNVGAVEALEELQLSGGIAVNELERLAAMLHGIDGAAASRQGSVGVAENLILSLNRHRSDRVALLLSVFPNIHWGILTSLSLAICVTFLLTSNQQVLQYLNSVQLRALFAILVGVGSGTATLCLDLADPFRGSFSLASASSQLGDLRVCLEEDVAEASAEAGEISSSIVRKLLGGGGSGGVGKNIPAMGPSERLGERSRDRGLQKKLPGGSGGEGSGGASNGSKRSDSGSPAADSPSSGNGGGDGGGGQWGTSQSRYGVASTLYFHLLTGPLGSNVRLIGDVLAWLATIVAGRTRLLSRRIAALLAPRRAAERQRRRQQQRRLWWRLRQQQQQQK